MKKVMKLLPIVKSYIWGGQYFQKFGKSDLDVVSELWELSINGEDTCLEASTRKPLSELVNKDDLGPNAVRFPYFPLLIKLIDAKDNLSVQVHPSDDYALKYENQFGKCEMWYVLDADEGSGLYVGLNDDYSKEEIETKLKDSSIMDCLNFFPVKTGDVFLIKPGTIHAIGKGVRIIEIQQNSKLTYRLYDYLRKDKNGNYRELHIDKALKVIDYHKYLPTKIDNGLLADTEYFKVNKLEFDGEVVLSADQGSFISFTLIDGEGQVDELSCNKFDTFFLPFGKKCLVKGKGTLIISRV